jgi:hypothetical protein
MDLRWLLIAALLAVLLSACGGDELSVTGVILEVDAPSLTEIDSFTFRTNEGETLVFRVAPDAAADPLEGFVPGHLQSHALLAEQVEIFYREEGGELLALRLVDR